MLIERTESDKKDALPRRELRPVGNVIDLGRNPRFRGPPRVQHCTIRRKPSKISQSTVDVRSHRTFSLADESLLRPDGHVARCGTASCH